ncbi:MAG: chemoreceptor glutamine deamidase CheD [Hyphomicrobiaceae bacterium]|nr:chemoreceptor glutamine deamidase CheD [Hyphomicrobiaceae bacterium]
MASTLSLPDEVRSAAVRNINQGECFVTGDADQSLSTILGSCVAACVRDEVARVGGMNHFLLGEQSHAARDQFGASARYGAFAMEQLINKVLAQGTGRKSNLRIKVFGGGNISASLSDIGAANIAFVRRFLADEGYQIAAEDLGGTFARRVIFHPESGRIFVKRLDAATGQSVAREEMVTARAKVIAPPSADDIELF